MVEHDDERKMPPSLDIATSQLARAWAAQQAIAGHSHPGSDDAGVAEWAEETLEWMIEMSDWLAETWAATATAMERAAETVAGPVGASGEPTAEELLAPSAPEAAAPGPVESAGEPTAEELLAPTSFLDALATENGRRPHHAA